MEHNVTTFNSLLFVVHVLDDTTETSAFTASINTSYCYNYGDVVIFDLIVSNIGNNYQAKTSTYVCLRHGLYVFSVSLYNDYVHSMVGDLMHEDETIASASATIKDETSQGSVTVVIECATGEQV